VAFRMAVPSAGALGGARNEAGSGHRAGIAALIIAYGLLEERVPWFKSTAPPVRLRLEADDRVDDIVVTLGDGSRVFIQAKQAGSKEDLDDAVHQWCQAVLAGQCNASDELFLIVGAQAPLRRGKLSQALRQHQQHASATPEAQRLLKELRKQVQADGLDASQVALLLDTAVIKSLDADKGGRDEALGAACLNAAVVAPSYGQAAFAALRGRLKEYASDRAPSDFSLWHKWLKDAKVPLTSDATGALPARLQAEDDAVDAYRERWRHSADTVPLADLGMGLTSLRVPGLAANLCVATPKLHKAQDRYFSGRLASLARRQGRLMLVGLPGMGKTVALQQLASLWAGQPLAPVPVWVRLRDLEPFLPANGPYRLTAADLLKAAHDVQDPHLAAGLERALNPARHYCSSTPSTRSPYAKTLSSKRLPTFLTGCPQSWTLWSPHGTPQPPPLPN